MFSNGNKKGLPLASPFLLIPTVKIVIPFHQRIHNEREREGTNRKPMGDGAKYGNNP